MQRLSVNPEKTYVHLAHGYGLFLRQPKPMADQPEPKLSHFCHPWPRQALRL